MSIEDVLINALGGDRNIVEIEPCTMRIRVQVVSQHEVNEEGLRAPGVLAVVRSGEIVQIVCGATSDDIAHAMQKRLDNVAHGTQEGAMSGLLPA